MKKTSAVILSVCVVILAATSVLAQEQKDPFKKEQAGKIENTAQPQQLDNMLISIEARLIEIPKQAADELFKEQGGIAKTFVINEKTLGALGDMVSKNKAKLVAQAKNMSKSGSSCEVKSVRAVTYPTEYQHNVQSNGTVSAGKASISPVVVTPAAFETRDVGTVLEVCPTITPGKIIEMQLHFSRVRLSAHPYYKAETTSAAGKTEMEQPVFIEENASTAVDIMPGDTVLVSVYDSIEDHDKLANAGDNILLLVMTANIITVHPVETPSSKGI